MESKVRFGWTSHAYVEQPDFRLNLTGSKLTGYQELVSSVIDVITTDSLFIVPWSLTSEPPLSMGLFLFVDPLTGLPVATSANPIFTYLNGTTLEPWPVESFIYESSVINLMNVVTHAVNLDLGNTRTPNLFRNASALSQFLDPNRPPKGVSPSRWVDHDYETSLGTLLPAYGSWAHALLNGKPFQVGDATGLPSDSVMVTNYLCPTYRLKQTGPLVTSIIIGVVSMGSTAWAIMMGVFVLVLLLKKPKLPKVQCVCNGCKRMSTENEMLEKGETPQLQYSAETVEASKNRTEGGTGSSS